MGLNEKQIAEMARQQLRYPNASRNLGLITIIPNAIERLATMAAQDENKKFLFLTPTTLTAPLDGAGKVDLSTIITTNKIIAEFMDRGYIWHSSSTKPLQFIQNPEMATLGSCEDDVIFYWMRGRVLYTRNKTPIVGTPLSGNLTLELPFIPTLANFPEEMTLDLVNKVCELATNPRGDFAEDGRG